MPIYKFPNGDICTHPTSYELACEVKSRVYDDGEKCPKCNSRYRIRYTKTQECVACATVKAGDFYNLCKRNHRYVGNDEDGLHWGECQPGYRRQISDEEWSEMLKLAELYHSDDKYTVSEKPCKTHGHYGLKRHGKCYQCHSSKNKISPRQEAMHEGKTWYTPTSQCTKCGEKALRNVHNGQCQGCVPPKNTKSCATISMMEQNPDMVIKREDAKSLEMTVYRTGEPCSYGHTGWRYVSTGNCIQCRKDDK